MSKQFKTFNMKEIKILYGKLKDKKAFCTELSKKVETSPLSIYNHWFGSFWAIPEKYQEIVLTMLKEKQQIIDAYFVAGQTIENAEQYYNETFKND